MSRFFRVYVPLACCGLLLVEAFVWVAVKAWGWLFGLGTD